MKKIVEFSLKINFTGCTNHLSFRLDKIDSIRRQYGQDEQYQKYRLEIVTGKNLFNLLKIFLPNKD